MMDLVLLATVARLALGPGAKVPAFYLLALSLGLLFASDVAYGLTVLAGTYGRARLTALTTASLVGPVVMAAQTMSGQHVDIPVFAGASPAISVLVLVRMSELVRRLANLSTRRAEALDRERTLRTVAGPLAR